MAFDVGIEDELNICKYCIIKLQSFANEESFIDVMEFEKILRMSTGDELDKDEIKMVIMKNNFKKVIYSYQVLKLNDSLTTDRGKINPRRLCSALLKLEEEDDMKLRKVSKNLAIISRMRM